jgi:hypothetical protein
MRRGAVAKGDGKRTRAIDGATLKVSRGVSGNEIMALPASTIAMFRRALMNEDTVVVSFVRESFDIPVGNV